MWEEIGLVVAFYRRNVGGGGGGFFVTGQVVGGRSFYLVNIAVNVQIIY